MSDALVRLLLILLGCSTSLGAAEPNIVFILADDLGWREPGCYGNTFNETPNIDRLAREGARFTQAYAAAPVCSPTRAALLTGQWPARLRITDYLGPQEKERYLKPEMPTLVKDLKVRGYRCGLIGKWHLTGDYALMRGAPQKHGWDEVLCSETKYIGPGYYYPPYKHFPEERVLPGLEYLTDRLNYEAVEFIRRNQAKPFFLYLSHYAPHTALVAKKEIQARYAAKPGAAKTENNPALAAMLESIDVGVGAILAVLEELNLAENTLIVFTSDNGGESRVTNNAPLRGGKSTLYEGGIRVSLLARWPKGIRAGTELDAPVGTLDLHATIRDAANVALGAQIQGDGVSLMPALRGGTLAPREMYWHYPLKKPHFLGGRSAGAVRSGDWKLIEFFDTAELELYNLSEDPGEVKNLVSSEKVRADALLEKLRNWRAETQAEMLQEMK